MTKSFSIEKKKVDKVFQLNSRFCWIPLFSFYFSSLIWIVILWYLWDMVPIRAGSGVSPARPWAGATPHIGATTKKKKLLVYKKKKRKKKRTNLHIWLLDALLSAQPLKSITQSYLSLTLSLLASPLDHRWYLSHLMKVWVFIFIFQSSTLQ